MPYVHLRRHALTSIAAISVALAVPFADVTALTPTANASSVATPTSTVSAPTAPTAAQIAAEKTAAAKAAKKRAAAKKKARQIARGKKIVRVAARYKGRPYKWAAAGPRAFDCSGYTLFVVRKALGVSLPHYTVAQKNSRHVKKVKAKDRSIGDLVFYHRGGTIGHVGIYAGNGKMWDSPRTGYRVGKRPLHSGKLTYGRVA